MYILGQEWGFVVLLVEMLFVTAWYQREVKSVSEKGKAMFNKKSVCQLVLGTVVALLFTIGMAIPVSAMSAKTTQGVARVTTSAPLSVSNSTGMKATLATKTANHEKTKCWTQGDTTVCIHSCQTIGEASQCSIVWQKGDTTGSGTCTKATAASQWECMYSDNG